MESSRIYLLFSSFFFFQAEDGIRDLTVTGVQTCALPICGLLLCVLLLADRNESDPTPRRLIALGLRKVRDVPVLSELPVLVGVEHVDHRDRKSTRLNSSHSQISYAVFCLKKKKLAILAIA